MARVVKALQLPEVGDLVGSQQAGRRWLDESALRRRAGEHLNSVLTRELWKYTPIHGLLEALAESGPGEPARLEHADQAGIRALPLDALGPADEARVRRLVDDDLNPDRHPVADLALLRARGGWLVEISAEVPVPVEIHYPSEGIVPVFLCLGANASVTLIEHVRGGGLLARVGHAALGPGARLTQYSAALHSGETHDYVLQSVRLERDAAYELNQSCVGGRRRRRELHVVLEGPGARADMAGAYLVEDGQHLDQQLVVEHRAPHTVSRQKFHGVGAGKGRSVFNGRIHIHRHCPGSDANLSNRNLALHADAEMNTKPELEIYTDDVRCAHGATVGQLSADALFYLTARGIPEPEAKKLLAHGFVRECLAGPLAEAAAARFAEALT